MSFTTFLLCILFAFNVSPMAIKGPVLTRYEPCGLGVLYFDKLNEYWQGVIYFGLYKNFIEAECIIVFKDEVTVSVHTEASSFTARRTNKHDLIINAVKPIPDRYTFYVKLDNIQLNDTEVPYVSSMTLNNVTLCNEEIKATQTVASFNVSKKYTTKHYAHICGRRSIEHEELISVRTEAKAGDWPWHVAIFVEDLKTGVLKYECGGNIVSRTAIVTAGHCVYKYGTKVQPNKVMIVAGINNHADLNQVGRQTFTADEVILHPAYNDEFATSDIAVIRITGLEYTEYVQPICIWGPVYDKTNLFGKEATVVGFGSTEYNELSETLRSTYIMVQNDTTCINFDPKLYRKLLNEFTFCAGYGPTTGINPRNGDSGGGLVISTIQADHKVSWFLRGVLSKCGVAPGHKECDPSFYVVYTDVGPYYGWIYHHSGLEFRTNVLQS